MGRLTSLVATVTRLCATRAATLRLRCEAGLLRLNVRITCRDEHLAALRGRAKRCPSSFDGPGIVLVERGREVRGRRVGDGMALTRSLWHAFGRRRRRGGAPPGRRGACRRRSRTLERFCAIRRSFDGEFVVGSLVVV